jgi:uncharacterized protein (DUF433 family)
MSANATAYSHLSADPGGRVWVTAANVKVIEIVADYLAHGSSAEEMALQFPHLSPSMIHSALAYYYDHREELETELAESLESSRLKASAMADSPLRQRLGLAVAKP